MKSKSYIAFHQTLPASSVIYSLMLSYLVPSNHEVT